MERHCGRGPSSQSRYEHSHHLRGSESLPRVVGRGLLGGVLGGCESRSAPPLIFHREGYGAFTTSIQRVGTADISSQIVRSSVVHVVCVTTGVREARWPGSGL